MQKQNEKTLVPETPTPKKDAFLDSLSEDMRDPSSGTDLAETEAAQDEMSPRSESEGGFNVRQLVEGGVDRADTELEEHGRRLRDDK